MRPKAFRSLLLPLFAATLLTSQATAEDHPGGVPALSSRPGAAYTVYLNVAGFTWDGAWGGDGSMPGVTPALNEVPDTSTFNATEQEQIKLIWARMAQSYVGLDVNVTTVDPAVAAGQAATDAARRTYYDNQPNMMHTVIGSALRDHDNDINTAPVSWAGTADGLSGLGIAGGVAASDGDHTNFMLSQAQAGAATGFVINGDYIGAISAHENGHAFGLNHQGDFATGATTPTNEYTNGDAAAGDGSYVAIMGNASERQRVAWRVGDVNADGTRVIQNDISTMLALSAGLTITEDGIGHTRQTATPLTITGNAVDFNSAHGVIVPAEMANPTPANTTEDWFSFTLDSKTEISLTAHNSTQFLTPGEADGVGTLRSKLTIFDVDGIELMLGTEAVDTLLTSLSTTLTAGDYFASIGALPPHMQDSPGFDPSTYYNMGAYFLTGSFNPVPEPGTITFFVMGMFLVVRRRRSA